MFKLLAYKNLIQNTRINIVEIDFQNLQFNMLVLKLFQFYRFQVLSTISCVDFPEKVNRFELNYHLLSIDFTYSLILRTSVSEFNILHSIFEIFSVAVWLEREIWDMFGIYFKNNLDLRRILTDYGFQYHPLRKTFPLQGYHNIYYDYLKKKILYRENKYSQLKSVKTFENSWTLVVK